MDEDVSVDENFTNMARMIASDFVIFDSLILAVVFVVEFADPIPQILGLFVAFGMMFL